MPDIRGGQSHETKLGGIKPGTLAAVSLAVGPVLFGWLYP